MYEEKGKKKNIYCSIDGLDLKKWDNFRQDKEAPRLLELVNFCNYYEEVAELWITVKWV